MIPMNFLFAPEHTVGNSRVGGRAEHSHTASVTSLEKNISRNGMLREFAILCKHHRKEEAQSMTYTGQRTQISHLHLCSNWSQEVGKG